MSRRVVVGDLAELQRTLGMEFEARASDIIGRRGKCIVALTGGSVAPAFFPTLARVTVDWTRVEIFWIDERAVPPDHPDSNYALALRLLLVPARVPAERVHRMPGELPDLAQAARRASDELKSIAGDPPHLDLALLGVGEDGHIASIFNVNSGGANVGSGGAGLQSCHDPVFPVYDSPKRPSRRLSLSFPVLSSAGLVIVIALGVAKATVMRTALDESGSTPIAELLRRAPASLVLLDRDAALS
jgi:6-phosphogluconolactonase